MSEKQKFVIGITGYKGSGKNTLSDFMQGGSWTKGIFSSVTELHFAEPLYKMMEALFPFIGIVEKDSIPTTRENKESMIPFFRESGKAISRRVLLQTLGTDWGRNLIHPDIWLMIMQRRINEAYRDLVIITDVRFDNEAELIRKNGGIIIDVVRDDLTTNRKDLHASERGIDSKYVDITVINNGSLEDLKEFAEKRLWKLIVSFGNLGPLKKSVFPVRYITKSREEWQEAEVPKDRFDDLMKATNAQVTEKVLEVCAQAGVVMGVERMTQIRETLQKEGLL